MGYAADPAGSARDLDTYGESAVSVIFRPSTPDCDSAEDLRAKVDLARERGLGRVDFYHYGLMRLDALDWIREARRPHLSVDVRARADELAGTVAPRLIARQGYAPLGGHPGMSAQLLSCIQPATRRRDGPCTSRSAG